MTSWRSGNSVTHRCRFVGTAGGLSSAPGRQQLCVQCLLSSQQVLGAGLWLVPFGLVIVPTPRLHSSRWLWGQFWGVHSCVWGGGLCLQNSREASVSMPLCSAEPILWSLVLLVGNGSEDCVLCCCCLKVRHSSPLPFSFSLFPFFLPFSLPSSLPSSFLHPSHSHSTHSLTQIQW